MSRLSKIVILTTRGGEGLISGSHAIRDALLQQDSELQIDIIDFFEGGGSLLGSMLTSFYNLLLRRSLLLNSVYIRLLHAMRLDRWKVLCGATSRQFDRIVKEYRPDLIIVTSQYIIAPVCTARTEQAIHIPIIVANIDPAPPSSLLWFDQRVDLHLLPTDEAVQAYTLAGMPIERATRVSIIVRDRFREASCLNPLTLLTELGLNSELPLVLMSGSREASSGMTNLLVRILHETDSQVVMICGTNTALQQKLRALTAAYGNRVQILGWRTDMERILRASDLVISKPGKQTMIESLATGTPLVAICYPAIMEQEQGNLVFLRNEGIAIEATSENESIHLINKILSDRPFAEKLRSKIRTSGDHHISARAVATAVTSFAESYSVAAHPIDRNKINSPVPLAIQPRA